MKPHHGLIEVVGPKLVLLTLGLLSIEIALKVSAAPGRHVLEICAKSSLFFRQDVKGLKIVIQEQLGVREVKCEGGSRQSFPETLTIVEDPPHGIHASHKHLVGLIVIPVGC